LLILISNIVIIKKKKEKKKNNFKNFFLVPDEVFLFPLETVKKPPFDESEIERCRAFIRLSLNEGTLHSYFAALVADQKLLPQYYGPTAVFAVQSLSSSLFACFRFI
jgi:hypothetical protein